MAQSIKSGRILKLCFGVVVVVFCMGSSCLDPCKQLADKICCCQPAAAERQACTRQATIQEGQRTPSNPQRLACNRYLTSCECRALQAGHLESCGLSRE